MTYNISMSELPISCPVCGEENMVDMDNLDGKPISKIVTELGFSCAKCDAWVKVSYTTMSLDTALERVARIPTDNKSFHFHFAKALKKAEGIQERYGTF